MRKSLSTITIVLAILLAPLAAHADDTAEASSRGVVNINTADASQLALLPRIGPAAAERIVQYRQANGQFKKTTDLMQVKGIGDKTFEILSPYLVVEGKTTLTTKQQGPKRPRAKKGAAKEASPQAQ